jgi:hypothetical protein
MHRRESWARGSEMNGGAAPLVMELCDGAQLKSDARGLLDGLNQVAQGHGGLLHTWRRWRERDASGQVAGVRWDKIEE